MPEPDHTATIDTMIAAIDAQPYSAAGERMRLVLVMLRDVLKERAAMGKRLAGLEAWRDTMTGDGK